MSRAIPHHAGAVARARRSTGIRSPRRGKNLQFAHRQIRRLAVDARHLVVLVLRRDLPHAVPEFTRATCWAATSTSSRCCSRCSRSASAPARCCASGCRATRSRSGWCRSARSASRCSRSTCGSRRAACTRRRMAASARSCRSPAHWRVVADLVLIGMFGGFYIVPLYALIQERSPPSHRSRIIAANNILNALFMVASAGLAIGLLDGGPVDSRAVPRRRRAERGRRDLHLHAGARVPDALPRVAARPHVLPRARGRASRTFRTKGPCIVVCNHVSYVDALVIAGCVRRPIRFVMDHRIFRIPVLVVHLPHDARDPDRVGARRIRR